MPNSRHRETARSLPVIEILHRAEPPVNAGHESIEYLGDLTKAVTVYAGKNAFRIYQASDGVIGKNAINTLQGMVKSAKWRTVFRVSSEVGEKIEVLAFIAAFAENVTKAAPEFDTILTSDESPARKCVHLAQLADAIGKRTAVGLITSGVSTIYEALKGWCLIGTLVGGSFGQASRKCVNVLEDADFRVKTAGNTIADFAAASNPILNTIDLVLQ